MGRRGFDKESREVGGGWYLCLDFLDLRVAACIYCLIFEEISVGTFEWSLL